jgi:alpha,alpha-trehalase
MIFDLDGVVTDTAEAHAKAWKAMFDPFLEQRDQPPFDGQSDYSRYVDGKPRYDGVHSFLESRDIELAWGSKADPPGRETVCGLGNRKNEIYQEFIESGTLKVYPPAVTLIREIRSRGIKTAVVSSSKNCARVLAAAGIADLFDVRVDGVVSEELKLTGKPAPDIFLKAAESLGIDPRRAVVLEDALAGVEAGRRGAFGFVIGVDRRDQAGALKAHGADQVVTALSALDVDRLPQRREARELPRAMAHIEQISRARSGKPWALFLDFDGTLSPIVERPEQAHLVPGMQAILEELAARSPVAIVSGRGLSDVRQRVGLGNLTYAGSHGFEIDGPGHGASIKNERGAEALPALEAAEGELRERLVQIEGAQLERKKYSLAVHYRRVAAHATAEVEQVVSDVLDAHPELRKGKGKKVFELQPDVDWDKGRAVLWLMERQGFDLQKVRPIYIGDDVTDEDAFRALWNCGVGIVVHGDEERGSFADYGLHDPQEVKQFLHKLTIIMKPKFKGEV